MRAYLILLSVLPTGAVGMAGALATATDAGAQSRVLPKGSSLAATPPIDRRGKQFHALSPAYQRHYLQQGFHPHRHPY